MKGHAKKTLTHLNPNEIRDTLREVRRGFFHPKKSVGLRVVRQNTGHNVLKVTQQSLIGVNIFERIKMYVDALGANA